MEIKFKTAFKILIPHPYLQILIVVFLHSFKNANPQLTLKILITNIMSTDKGKKGKKMMKQIILIMEILFKKTLKDH
jgi:hypothetical protein